MCGTVAGAVMDVALDELASAGQIQCSPFAFPAYAPAGRVPAPCSRARASRRIDSVAELATVRQIQRARRSAAHSRLLNRIPDANRSATHDAASHRLERLHDLRVVRSSAKPRRSEMV